VPGDHYHVWAYEDRIRPPELADAGGYQRDLRVCVGPGIPDVRDELVDWNQSYLQIPHEPTSVMNRGIGTAQHFIGSRLLYDSFHTRL